LERLVNRFATGPGERERDQHIVWHTLSHAVWRMIGADLEQIDGWTSNKFRKSLETVGRISFHKRKA
jgi:hypothetical protein